MKGRDSAFGDITPCSTCVSFIRTRSLQRLPPSSFLQQQKRVGGASGQGNHLGDVPLGRSRVQLMLLQSRTPPPPFPAPQPTSVVMSRLRPRPQLILYSGGDGRGLVRWQGRRGRRPGPAPLIRAGRELRDREAAR